MTTPARDGARRAACRASVRADRAFAVPARDRRGHLSVVVRDDAGRAGSSRPSPSGVMPGTDELAMFFGTFNMLAGAAVARAAAAAHRARAAPARRRPGALHRARRADVSSIRLPRLRHAGGRRRAAGQRPGAALLDRQGRPWSCCTCRCRRRRPSGQVVHRHGRLPAGDGLAALSSSSSSAACSADAGAGDRGSTCCCSAAGWLRRAVAQRQYVENLRDSIHQHRVDTERASAPVLDRAAADLLRRS